MIKNQSLDNGFRSVRQQPSAAAPRTDPTDAETFRTHFRPTVVRGVRKLMLAVMQSALEDIDAEARGQLSLATEYSAMLSARSASAKEWVSSDDRSWPFAFATICDVLGYDTEAVRAALLSRRAERIAGVDAGLATDPLAMADEAGVEAKPVRGFAA